MVFKRVLLGEEPDDEELDFHLDDSMIGVRS